MKSRDDTKLHDGFQDGLLPVVPLDLKKCGSIDQLVRAMGDTSFGGRTIGQAADVLEAMGRDESCKIVLTLSGAMTVAKMGLLICDMIEHDLCHAIVSTGALICHGLVEGMGHHHFRIDPNDNDTSLYYKGYDRVYDTIEPEQNLVEAEGILSKVLDQIPAKEILASHSLLSAVGQYLVEHFPGNRSILGTALAHQIPVYVPAFTDSELGMNFGVYNLLKPERQLRFDPFVDLASYADFMDRAPETGIFTIGGGVPRNWAQQVFPYLDISKKRQGKPEGDERRFKYGVRICPEPVHWGGLSGCTYSEGVSWGKFLPKEEGGMWAEVPCDATIAWPLVVGAVLERMGNLT